MTTPTAQTAADVISDSLLNLNVIRAGQIPTATQQNQLIRRLNQMMALWESNGIHLGYVPVGEPTDVLTVPDGALLGIMSHLAIHSAPLFGASVSPELAAMAEVGKDAIDKLTCSEVLATTELQRAADRWPHFNISSG